MRTLFEIDKKDYEPGGVQLVRPSVRAIILRDGRPAMVHSLKYDYYKFPGGGIEPGESHLQALKRETLEEAGLVVREETVREYGLARRVEKSDLPGVDVFMQDNFYYLCEVLPERQTQTLDDYEAEERFTLEFPAAQQAIAVNRAPEHGPKSQAMIEREARVLELLIAEGYLPE